VSDELIRLLREALREARKRRTERHREGLAPSDELEKATRAIEVALLRAMVFVRLNGLVLLPEDKA
jgi:hypothetical protein